MLFNSWEFLNLLLMTIPLYYLPFGGSRRRVWQVGLLLAASAVFYAWEEPRLLLLLGLSCVANAVAVERIIAAKAESRNLKSEIGDAKAKLWLFWTVALNLGFLALFKYAGFVASLLPASSVTESLKHWFAGIPLPVGISFYTFQGISLVLDVWRSDISEQTAERLSGRGHRRISSVRDTSFYIAFLPQLVAGPIVKAHEFIDQIGSKMIRDIDWKTVRRGLVLGYFFKIFVADNLAEQTGTLTLGAENLANNGPLNLLPLLYCYSLQIFADFAGYSLIAIGLGALFGYRIPSNFNFPYLATSITDFWRRWHISLSSWLRDYLYIPLGGNRKGAVRTYFNLFLVMFLGGLWHGAAWKFAVWGSLHGLFLALERLLVRRQATRGGGQESGIRNREAEIRIQRSEIRPLTSVLRPLTSALRFLLTFHLVTFLWLTFMMPDIASIRGFFEGLLSGRSILQGPPVFSLVFYGSAVVLYHAWGWFRQRFEHFAAGLMRSPVEPVLHGIMLFLVVSNPGAPRGFIYFQF